MKVVIPVEDEEAMSLSEHFGRAPYFAVYDVTDDTSKDVGVYPNDSDHFGGSGHPPERIMELGAEVVISMGMGMRAIKMFQEVGVAVLKAEMSDTSKALMSYQKGELMELTEGCLHAHEHDH